MLIIRMITLGSILVLYQCPQAFSQAMPTELRQETTDTSSSIHGGQQSGSAMLEHRSEHEYQDRMSEQRPEQLMPKAMPEKLPEAMPEHMPEKPIEKSVRCVCNCANVALQRKYIQLKRQYESLLVLYKHLKVKCIHKK